MILFLLKCRRLRVQLFVGLLFALGTIPEGSEGLKCLVCKNKKDEVCREIRTCAADFVCMNVTGAVSIARDCVLNGPISRCWDAHNYTIEGTPCAAINRTYYQDGSYYKNLRSCGVFILPNKYNRTSSQGRDRSGTENTVKQCLCHTDFCNSDQPPPSGSQRQQASSRKMIFAILTSVVVYSIWNL